MNRKPTPAEERAHHVYLFEELPLPGESRPYLVIKCGHGCNPEEAKRECERGNPRTLVVRYATPPLTQREAVSVEHTAQRLMHRQWHKNEWFRCLDVAFAQKKVEHALYYVRYPPNMLTMLGPPPPPEPEGFDPTEFARAPTSTVARSIAALRAHRTRALERDEAETAAEYQRRIDALMPIVTAKPPRKRAAKTGRLTDGGARAQAGAEAVRRSANRAGRYGS